MAGEIETIGFAGDVFADIDDMTQLSDAHLILKSFAGVHGPKQDQKQGGAHRNQEGADHQGDQKLFDDVSVCSSGSVISSCASHTHSPIPDSVSSYVSAEVS